MYMVTKGRTSVQWNEVLIHDMMWEKKQRNLENTMLNERSSHETSPPELVTHMEVRKRRSALVRQILGCQDPGKGAEELQHAVGGDGVVLQIGSGGSSSAV